MKVEEAEFREGLNETRQYLLSHHERSDWHRCYAPTVFGQQVHICARCLGIYPGIIAGILAYFLAPTGFTSYVLIVLLPLPALVDWIFTSFTRRQGYNLIRTATGGLLGLGYGMGIIILLKKTKLEILGIGVVYAFVAIALIFVRYKFER